MRVREWACAAVNDMDKYDFPKVEGVKERKSRNKLELYDEDSDEPFISADNPVDVKR